MEWLKARCGPDWLDLSCAEESRLARWRRGALAAALAALVLLQALGGRACRARAETLQRRLESQEPLAAVRRSGCVRGMSTRLTRPFGRWCDKRRRWCGSGSPR